MDRIGPYTEKVFSTYRKNISLISREGSRKLAIHSLVELDVTQALNLIKELKQSGKDVSFTAWIIKCIAQGASEHPDINSYRQGRRKIILFDEVDIPQLPPLDVIEDLEDFRDP